MSKELFYLRNNEDLPKQTSKFIKKIIKKKMKNGLKYSEYQK